MSERRDLADIFTARRHELVRYAGVVSGDTGGAEDLVQEAWLRCHQTAAAETVAQPVHLLWRVLRNLAIDRGRRLATERRTVTTGGTEQFPTVISDAQPSAERALIAREELARIQRVLDGLDHETRAAFAMHRLEGAKLREIAARLGISVTTAHERVTRAVALIRTAVREDA